MQKGFTLVELITVIVILGIVAVMAVPKFIDISDDANIAVTKFEAANFKSAIKLIHNAYQIKQVAPIQVGDQLVEIDSVSRWPTGNGSGDQFCVNLWNKVLDTSAGVVGVSSPTAALSNGWNAFGNPYFCAYGKQFGDLSFASGNLPHFVYYIRDFGPYTYNSQTYDGNAGEVQSVNL